MAEWDDWETIARAGGGGGEDDWILIDEEEPCMRTIGTMGKGERILRVDQEAVLFDYKASCGNFHCLNHFWFGGNFPGVENTRIRYYVDGEEIPSIDMELYLGHGIGFGSNQNSPWVTKHIGKVGRKNGIHNNYRIPFGNSIRVTAQRASGGSNDTDNQTEDVPQSWWIIRGTSSDIPLSIRGAVSPQSQRLFLVKLEGYTAQPLEEFDLCNISGRGALLQVTIAAQSTSFVYLESCIRAYLQPDSQEPTMLSSGLEDYFLGTYYFDSGPYHSDIAGLTHFDKPTHSFSAYRFHNDDQDPVWFDNGLRLTCRCGETEHGRKDSPAYLHPQPTTYTTYVWYYQ